jgi:phosphoribosylamine--glycine ligase
MLDGLIDTGLKPTVTTDYERWKPLHWVLEAPDIMIDHGGFDTIVGNPPFLGGQKLTGVMGTLVSYRGGDRLFAATLGRVAPLLRASGYVGYINLNMIVNDEGAFPLEFTSRLGVPGFAILSALHSDPWDVLLSRLVTRTGPHDNEHARFATHGGFAIGVVLTVPPFPYPDGYERLSKGAPIVLNGVDAEELSRLHYAEVARDGDQLVTAGQIGYVMVVTGRGDSVHEARQRAYALVDKVVIPNLRYRRDIGEAYELREREALIRLGWLPR